MKAGWEVKLISEFAQTGAGGTPTKGTSEYYDGGTIPWLLSGEVANANITEATKFITDKGLAASSAKLFPKGSVLVAMYGATAGEVGILRFEASTNQAVCAIKPNKDYVTEYLYYYLLKAKALLASQATGGAQPNISQAKIKALAIPLPRLAEQKRIVSILDEAFEGLDRARENAEANLKSARELFESVLLSVFGTMSEKNDLFLLKEVSKDFARGKSKHRPRNDKSLYGGDYPFIQTGDVRNAGHRITAFTATYNEKGLAQSKLWPSGTVCITIAANIAETSILSFDACFPDSVIGMVPDEAKTSSDYMEYVLQFFQKRLKAAGEGAAQDNINLKTFESEYFPFPSLAKQASAISKLNTASEIHQKVRENYSTKLQDISDLRQSLLQKAFAGELT